MEVSSTNYDFAGWATKCNILCSDGRTIMPDAFKHHDGDVVPLVWNHQHNDLNNVLGKALLHSRDGSVYAYCLFNDTESGRAAKKLVDHGDICSLSVCANQLRHNADRGVTHGMIRELSLVLAGANRGAVIDTIMEHSDDSEEDAIIYSGEDITLYHADDDKEEQKGESNMAEEKKEPDMKDSAEKSPKEIYEEMTKEQQEVCHLLVGEALASVIDDYDDEDEIEHSEGGNYTMKTNVFDQNGYEQEDTLMHADILADALADARRYGSLRESIMQHAAVNNITNIGELFPMNKDLNMPPEWIKEDDSWVAKVMGSVHHTPFSRVRALFGKMDESEARARGYIKGNMKADIALSILKRTTQPTTVYIKLKMDRDDIVDIADFDVIAWIKVEMRKNLDKELARAFLIGDGRELATDDKINEQCIVPVLTDDDMYTIKYTVTNGADHHNDFNSASENDSEAKGIIRAAIKSRKEYKGSGNPTFYTTEDILTELLLIEDQNGRRIYESEASLATAMRVKDIVTVPEMENHKNTKDVYGIIVNMADYNTGADKGGAVSMFDDFDIDYNQQKYLMETRCSGALVKPYSAIVLKKESAEG